MPTIRLQVPVDRSGEFSCTAIGQSGTTYRDVVAGSVIDVDARDVPLFLQLGFRVI